MQQLFIFFTHRISEGSQFFPQSEIAAMRVCNQICFFQCQSALLIQQLFRNMDCDYFRMLDGDGQGEGAFRGEYMKQYSWPERTAGRLYFKNRK